MVRDQRREPARALATLIARTDVGGSRGLDLDARGITAGSGRRFTDLSDEPADQVRVGQLQDEPVRDATGHGQRHRAVAGDPYRQRPAAGPREVQVRAFVRDGLAGDERPDDADRLLGVGERDRGLAEHASRRVAPADSQVHPPVRQLVERGEGRRGDGRFAGPRVGHARPETQPLGRAGHERQQRVGVAPQDVAVEEPAVLEPGRFRLAGQSKRALDRVLGLERESELHALAVLRCRDRRRA